MLSQGQVVRASFWQENGWLFGRYLSFSLIFDWYLTFNISKLANSESFYCQKEAVTTCPCDNRPHPPLLKFSYSTQEDYLSLRRSQKK